MRELLLFDRNPFKKKPTFISYMKKIILATFIALCNLACLYAQAPEQLLEYISVNSSINEGGSDVYSLNGHTYVISVAQVIVGTKSETNCKTVGAAKAKRDMLSFVNGSEISSYTELEIHENVIENTGEVKVESAQTFTEIIKEEVMGHINGVSPIGGWFSKDRSIYYYAIYKIIE